MPFFFIHCAEERSVKYFCQNVELYDKTHILTVGPGKNFHKKPDSRAQMALTQKGKEIL